MKFPCALENDLLIVRDRFGLYFATKRIGLPFCTLFTITFSCLLQNILLSNYLLPTILVLAEITLLKTTCHFLLLLIGFDTLIESTTIDPLYLWVISSPWRLHRIGIHRGWFLGFPLVCSRHMVTLTLHPKTMLNMGRPRGAPARVAVTAGLEGQAVPPR